MSIESVMPSPMRGYHLILCHPLLLLPSIFPSIKVFSNKLALHIRWPKYWSFSFSISPSNEYSGLISFREGINITSDCTGGRGPWLSLCLYPESLMAPAGLLPQTTDFNLAAGAIFIKCKSDTSNSTHASSAFFLLLTKEANFLLYSLASFNLPHSTFSPRTGPRFRGMGTRSWNPHTVPLWMWAAAGEGECLGKAADSRKSTCPVSPEMVVLAAGFSLRIRVNFNQDDLHPFQGGWAPVKLYLMSSG